MGSSTQPALSHRSGCHQHSSGSASNPHAAANNAAELDVGF